MGVSQEVIQCARSANIQSLIWREKKSDALSAKFKMSLLQLGPTIFGGTTGIITYMQSNGLLATTKMCTRFIHYITISGGLSVIDTDEV